MPPASARFNGEARGNATHANTTDREAKLVRKGPGKEGRLSFASHATMENRHGLYVLFAVHPAVGTPESQVAVGQATEPRNCGSWKPRSSREPCACRWARRSRALRGNANWQKCTFRRLTLSYRTPLDPSPRFAYPDLVRLKRPLDQFRLRATKVLMHPRERFLVGTVSLHLVFLPWALGGMRIWCHFICLALALVGFTVSLAPSDYRAEHSENGQGFRLVMGPKLMRFPLFWLGLDFLIFITLLG